MPQADNPMIGLIAQVGTEVSAGAGGNADKRLRNTKFNLKNVFDNVNEYSGEGQQFVNNVVPGDWLAQGDTDCPLSFTECCYLYDACLKTVTPTSGAGGSYTRVYRFGIPGVDAIRTYVIQKGNGRYNRQWNYAHWTGFKLAQSRQSASLGGPMVAQPNGGTGIIDTMTATPTKIPNVLVNPTKVGLFYAPTMALLATAPVRLTRNFDFSVDVSGLRAPFFPMNELVNSFQGTTEQAGVSAGITMRLGVDVYTPTTVPARANTTAYLLGDVLKKAAGPHTKLFLVIVAGTTAAAEPAAYGTAAVGDTIVDGTATVQAIDFDLGAPFKLADIKAGQTFYVMCRSLGAVIDVPGQIYYMHEFKAAVQATDLPDDGTDENGLATNTYNLRIVDDDVAGYPMEIKVVNKLATL